MEERKPSDQSERKNLQPVEKPTLNSPEGQQVRNATGDQVEAIKAANPDAHNGSATPRDKAWFGRQALIEEQSKSFELFEDDKVIAARVMEVARPAVIAKESIEQQSETVEELTKLAKVNPVYAPILGLRQYAEQLPPGQEKDKFVQLTKDQAAEANTSRQYRESDHQSEDQESCGSHTYESQRKPITIGQHNYSSNNLLAYDNSQSGIVTDATNATAAQEIPLDELDKRQIRDYAWGFKPDTPSAIETGVEYQVGYKQAEITEQAVFERVAALPLEQQATVLHAGIQAYHNEINYQQFRIAIGEITGLGESVVGMSQGVDSLGKSICDVAQFSRDIAENNPRAQDTAAQAGNSFGKLLVGGFSVVNVADNYLGSVGAASYEGDNTKAFRDISDLGLRMNQRWQSMSPEEKARLATKAAIDNLGPIAAAGAGAKLARSMDIAGALQEFGASASVFGPKEREKYSRVISKITEKLTVQPMGVTPDGRLMPIPSESIKRDTAVFMKEADDSLRANVGKSKEVQSDGSKGAPELTSKPLEKPPVLANGQPLVFDSTAPVEVRVVKANNPKAWDDLGRSPRGKEFHQEMGENLPTNQKGIDNWDARNKTATSFKTRDLRTDSYNSYKKLYEKLENDLASLEQWDCKITVGDLNVRPRDIRKRCLDIGIPDSVMTAEQKRAIEDISRLAAQKQLLFRITVIR